MSQRKVPGSNWLKGWHFWLQEFEAPDSYITWTGISALAGCTMRKIGVPWHYDTYYPNHYIILVGPAGIVHKSTAINNVRKLFREIGVPAASESQTREALIEQMISRGTGDVAAITAMPDELSDFIRPSGPPMIEFLTTIYGCPDEWEYTTRKRGTELVKSAFLNLLGGTTPRWIATEFDATFVEQGFASRTLFVHELEPRFLKANSIITPEMRKMYQCLVDDLHHISQLKGDFVWDEDAKDWFSSWYENESREELNRVDYRLRSYIARKPTHILKLAMILSLNVTDDLILSKSLLIQAKQELDLLEHSMARTFSAVGRNVYSNDLQRIAGEIQNSEGMSKAELIQRNYSAFANQQSFDETINMLIDMGYVRREIRGATIYYLPGPVAGSF